MDWGNEEHILHRAVMRSKKVNIHVTHKLKYVGQTWWLFLPSCTVQQLCTAQSCSVTPSHVPMRYVCPRGATFSLPKTRAQASRIPIASQDFMRINLDYDYYVFSSMCEKNYMFNKCSLTFLYCCRCLISNQKKLFFLLCPTSLSIACWIGNVHCPPSFSSACSVHPQTVKASPCYEPLFSPCILCKSLPDNSCLPLLNP